MTLDGFRRWYGELGEDAPPVHFLDGRLLIELAPQSYRSHVPVVREVDFVLEARARRLDLGRCYPDRCWITNEDAGLSTEPDGFFASWSTLEAGALALSPDREHELVGRPDMVFEVLSDSSEAKDEAALLTLYAAAGVREYWLIDARGEALRFDLHVLDGDAYMPVESDADGWRASPVWGAAFRLRALTDRVGERTIRLDVRE